MAEQLRTFSRELWSGLRRAAGALLGVVFPGDCQTCGETLSEATRIPICAKCLGAFQRICAPLCAVCGRPLGPWMTAGPEVPRCHLCRRKAYSFDRARSFAVYDEALVRAITLLKYEAVMPLAGWFAARLEEMVREVGSDLEADVIVPVPLHRSRLRERGYNQAELLARPLARRLGLPMRSELLVRIKPRPDKLKLTRHERWNTVRGAYAAREGARIDNLRVMLVDDVFTTGATLDACSRALRRGGAKQVVGVTVARVVEAWAEFKVGGEIGLARSKPGGVGRTGSGTAGQADDASKG